MEEYDVDKIDGFNWYYKDFYSWKFIHDNKKSQRNVFRGVNKKDPKISVIIKQIKIVNNYNKILKEIYFLVCFQKDKYSIELIDFFLSGDYIFIILNDEGENLESLIDYTEIKVDAYNNDSIKHQIFQIVYQLYIYHKHNLVHNDIKPSNILISSSEIVKIADFGSMDKVGAKSFGTFFYRSPENLINNSGSEKNDMWAVGVIMIELFIKKYPFFYDNNIKDGLSLIKSILSKYKIIINNNEININNNNVFHIFMYIKNNLNNNKSFNFKDDLKNIDEIKDPDAFDLIKNLLKINPKERFSAEEALNSKYLSKYKNEIQEYNVSYNINDYENMLSNIYNKFDFVRVVEKIKQKFLGLKLGN